MPRRRGIKRGMLSSSRRAAASASAIRQPAVSRSPATFEMPRTMRQRDAAKLRRQGHGVALHLLDHRRRVCGRRVAASSSDAEAEATDSTSPAGAAQLDHIAAGPPQLGGRQLAGADPRQSTAEATSAEPIGARSGRSCPPRRPGSRATGARTRDRVRRRPPRPPPARTRTPRPARRHRPASRASYAVGTRISGGERRAQASQTISTIRSIAPRRGRRPRRAPSPRDFMSRRLSRTFCSVIFFM